MARFQDVQDDETGRIVYKDFSHNKIADIIREKLPEGTHIMIVFYHGLGDVLMFLPVYQQLLKAFPKYTFDLGVLPGLGFEELSPEIIAVNDSPHDFVAKYAAAFVVSFDMVEGGRPMTKAEYCCTNEMGISPEGVELLTLDTHWDNKMVAVHFQGTCLPESTNPSEILAKQIWTDLIDLGYMPIDVHFKHTFHNPANKDWGFLSRHCRDLKPSLQTLASLINSSVAFIGVASGPFVLAASMRPDKTIYLQKHHDIECYLRDFDNVIKLTEYDKDKLSQMLQKMEESHVKIDTIGTCGPDSGCKCNQHV